MGNMGLRLSQPEFDTVIVRFGGEIGIKAEWTRKLYERRLMANIKAVMKENAISYSRFVRRFGRLYIKTSQAETAAEKLKKVFGVSSLSPSLETTSNLNDILSTSIDLAASGFKTEKSFSVRCHRIGEHPYTSQDVCRQVGQSLQTQLRNLKLRVDLTHPDQTLHIEVRDDKGYLYTSIAKGTDGLPLGTQQKLVNLLKGDIQSAVACWLTMKRGCPPILVHFENDGSTKEQGVKNAVETAKRLMAWSTGFPRSLYLIKKDQRFHKLAQKHSLELSYLMHKRLMLQIAQSIARMKNAEGIVTGDTIKEPSKHTIHTFRLQDNIVKGYPVYRPLVGMDTPEIQEIAQATGLKTAIRELKKKTVKKEQPKSWIELEEIQRIEKEMNTARMVEDALESLKVLKIYLAN